MENYTTPFKTQSVPFNASGIFFGIIESVSDKRLNIKVPRITGDAVFKNIEYSDSGFTDIPSIGELVFVSFLEGKKDDLVVLGRVKSSLNQPDVDLSGAVTGDFLQYDGTKFIAGNIDLGSLTVGNYVATIAGTANEIDVSGSGVESAAITLSLPATINADTTGSAAKWTTGRKITLDGDLTGDVTIDGSANATLTATVAANSVTLGTDTIGDYVSTLTAGTGLTISSGSGTGEGSTPTIAINSVQLGTNTSGDYVATIVAGTNMSISAGSGTGEGSTPTLATSTTPSFSTITSTVATGTSPLTVASTTLISNLNADLLDGQHGSWYTPSGIISPYAGLSAPAGWLFCDGSSVSRTTYADLWSTLSLSKGAVTSIANGASALVSKTSHGLAEGDAVYFTTTGALPTGLSINTTYYVKYVDANSFRLSTSRTATAASGAAASFTTSTAITTSSNGSGTHTLYHAPYGIPSASTTNFYLPDMRGRMPIGLDNINGTDAGVLTIPNAIGARSGEEKHTLDSAEIPAHTHTAGTYDALGIANALVTDGGGGNAYQAVIAQGSTATTRIGVNANTSGGGAHNALPPFMLVNYIIKT